MTGGEKTLSRERIEELRALARRLIDSPDEITAAERAGDLADMLGMLVMLMSMFIPTRPFQPPEFFQQDPQFFVEILAWHCRQLAETPIPPELLPWVILRFDALYKGYVKAAGKRGKAGAKTAGRAMAFCVEVLRLSVDEAATHVATAKGIEHESALREYRRYRAVADKSG
jgi:hypothetical protein